MHGQQDANTFVANGKTASNKISDKADCHCYCLQSRSHARFSLSFSRSCLLFSVCCAFLCFFCRVGPLLRYDAGRVTAKLLTLLCRSLLLATLVAHNAESGPVLLFPLFFPLFFPFFCFLSSAPLFFFLSSFPLFFCLCFARPLLAASALSASSFAALELRMHATAASVVPLKVWYR